MKNDFSNTSTPINDASDPSTLDSNISKNNLRPLISENIKIIRRHLSSHPWLKLNIDISSAEASICRPKDRL